ncbi:glycosyltransferase family 4 protein [Cytobacillus firmus]|uniref:glycosyltransferase family 4 protein n=1 Tax=Cytobacillus firmus TaxID=1399 RepID=UPI0021C5F6A6|nr:glycosyltransferase family 4 protein [Cytobacillus firmus]MCU1807112.1 glycosyltransferase family 4 protein [Cytobacillus firmus]
MKRKQIIIAHSGKQHSYRLAEALKNIGMLKKYVTTIYLKKWNMTGFAKRFLKGDALRRVITRKCSILNDNEVKQFCEFEGLINLLLLRIDKSQRLFNKWSKFKNKRFAKKVAYYAIKQNPEAVIMYDTNATLCFDILEKKAPHIKRILDVSSASHEYMKIIYKEDMVRSPQFSQALRKSVDYFWDEKVINEFNKEIQLAHFFLAPSKFVKKSIQYHGISPERIFICPYGVDTSKFKDNKALKPRRKLRCVYIGALTQRKGISYLLEAFKQYSKEDVSLTLIGKYDNSNGLFDEYLDRYNFTGFITHEKVAEILSDSDIMVFPSLSEGLSLSVMEALGSGIPVICSENSGYEDIIIDGYNGFIIPIGDSKVINEKVNWFINNKDKIPQMKINARNTALQYTWEAYNERVAKIVKSILSKRGA